MVVRGRGRRGGYVLAMTVQSTSRTERKSLLMQQASQNQGKQAGSKSVKRN